MSSERLSTAWIPAQEAKAYPGKLKKSLGVKVIGIIPEDPNVRRAAAARTPMVVKYPVFARIKSNTEDRISSCRYGRL